MQKRSACQGQCSDAIFAFARGYEVQRTLSSTTVVVSATYPFALGGGIEGRICNALFDHAAHRSRHVTATILEARSMLTERRSCSCPATVAGSPRFMKAAPVDQLF